MNATDILRHIDHTQLKATASWDDIQKLCEEAIQYGTASVCIPPCYVKRVRERFGRKPVICTVIGFLWDMPPREQSWRRPGRLWKTERTNLIW